MEKEKQLNADIAFELAIAYADHNNYDLQERIRVQNNERFRIDFDSIDMSYDAENNVIVIRSCVERHHYPPLPAFINMLDELQIEYKDELQDAIFEWDSTAIEVDLYDPNRFNMTWVLSEPISPKEFCKKLDDLHVRAKKFRNKHYINILEQAAEKSKN